MSQVTGAGLAAIQKAAGEKVRTSGNQRPDYPGADARLYKPWYISKNKDSVQEIVIAGAPVVLYAYRMTHAVRRNGKNIYPDISIHQSTKYHHAVQDGVPYKAERENVDDLYAATFGAPEMWTIVPVLVRAPKFDERRNRLPGTNEKYQFLELEPGDGILNTLIEAWQTKAVASRKGGLIGLSFDVRRTADDDPPHGRWTRKTVEQKDGSFVYKMYEPAKFLAYIKQQGDKKTDNDPKSNKRALYVNTVAEAYPLAEPDKQRMVLVTHFGIIEEHPDWAKRFPTPLKEWGTDMSGAGGEITLDGVSSGDGDEISLEDIDGGDSLLAAGGEAVDPVEAMDDGDEIDLGEDPETEPEEEAGEEEVEEAGEEEEEAGEEEEEGPVIYYANEVDESEGYVLPDGTPCDEYGDPIEEAAEEAAEEEAAEESGDVSSEDGAQDAGLADLEGDTSAFSHTDLDELDAPEEEPEPEPEPEPKKKVAPKGVKPTAKPTTKTKPAVKPATKKPAATPATKAKSGGKVSVKAKAKPAGKAVVTKKKK